MAKEVFVKTSSTLCASLAVLLLSSFVFAQGSTGRILGSVSDQSGAVIPGASISIRDVDRGAVRSLTTDEAGLYNAPNLLPGTFALRVELAGVAAVKRQN